ncbi:MAG: LacI family transcriptional regulator, partial [Spirochaetia bacterium]|nr:LacI family transcriptional regulator [Spirochaetia bacterium]
VYMGIKEIAELAGVSKTTVSLALNGQAGVSHETRMKVIELAKKLNYRLPAERSISHPSHGFIMFARLRKHGLLLNKDQSSFIMDYVYSINTAVCEAGYIFEIFDCKFENIDDCMHEIQDRRPKGVVVLGTELSVEDVKALQALTIPYVVLDTCFDQISCDFITMSNVAAVFEIVNYLVNIGHREIAMISCTVKSGNVLMRERGFRQASMNFGLVEANQAVFEVDPGFQGAYLGMKKLLSNPISLPQAFFCYNDVAACGTMKALKEFGYAIPKDISVVGFDDLPMSSMMDPPLTSMKVPNRQIGSMAARALLEKIASKKSLQPVMLLANGTLDIRDSVMKRL